MKQVTENKYNKMADLATNAFSAFYEDIGGIFDITAFCKRLSAHTGTLVDLKPDFSKYISIHRIRSKGALRGMFDLLFDRTGTFVLAGIFMMLPEKRVLEYIRNGKNFDAELVNNASAEAGNMLVGSWDRIFREAINGHEHFIHEKNRIGDPWLKPKEYFTPSSDEECCCIVCQVTIQPYPAFKCAVVFPASILSNLSEAMFGADRQSDSNQAHHTPPLTDYNMPSDAFFASDDNAQSPLITEPDSESSLPDDTGSNANKNVQTVSQVMNELKPDTAEQATISAAAEDAPQEQPAVDQPGPVRQAIDELTKTPEETTAAPLHASVESLTAQQIMRPAVLWADPEETVEQVINKMQQHAAGYVLVGSNGQIQGIVSRSDTASAVSPYLRSVFAHMKRPLDDASLQIRIKWFMSKPVHTVTPDASVEHVTQAMIKHEVRGLPVVDCNGDVLGLITAFEVMQTLVTQISRK